MNAYSLIVKSGILFYNCHLNIDLMSQTKPLFHEWCDEEEIQTNCVTYELAADETDGSWSRKGLNFFPDPFCNEKRACHSGYRNSGYSRGHLAPAGDMKWDSIAMLECFYFTNCIPQDASLNNGKWNPIRGANKAVGQAIW